MKMSSMLGVDAGSQKNMLAKLESMRAVVTKVNEQFKDPVRSLPTPTCAFAHTIAQERMTFVCVCISEFQIKRVCIATTAAGK